MGSQENNWIDICRTEAFDVLDGNEKITSSFEIFFYFIFMWERVEGFRNKQKSKSPKKGHGAVVAEKKRKDGNKKMNTNKWR